MKEKWNDSSVYSWQCIYEDNDDCEEDICEEMIRYLYEEIWRKWIVKIYIWYEENEIMEEDMKCMSVWNEEEDNNEGSQKAKKWNSKKEASNNHEEMICIDGNIF